MRLNWRILVSSLLLLAGLIPGRVLAQARLGDPSTATPEPQIIKQVQAKEIIPPPVASAPAPPTGPIVTLDHLIALAAQGHPEIAAAQARAQVARGKLIQSGLYPNPIFTPRINELGDIDKFFGEPGFTLTQEFVTAHKLKLNKAAGAQGVAAADWQAITKWQDVITRVRLAHVEVLAAQRELKTQKDIVALTNSGLEAAKKMQKAGAASQPDVLRAKVELETSLIRVGVSQRRLEAALRLLAATIGIDQLPAGDIEGNLDAPAPDYQWDAAQGTMLAVSSEVQEALALAQQAEVLYTRARAERMPNITVAVRPYYFVPDRNTLGLIEIGAPVPIFNRNQGNITAAAGDITRTRADVHTVELKLRERLTLAFQRYQAARQQVDAFQKQLLPNARESLRLIQLGYESGVGEAKFDFTAVLQAQVTLTQAQLAYVQSLTELWRAVTEINGLLQLDRR